VADEAQKVTRAEKLGRYHGALGAVLGVYVVFHLWQQWPALVSRDAWLDRARSAGLPSALKLLLLLVFLGHMLLGAQRLRTGTHPADTSPTAGLRRAQLFFGALTLFFLAVHVPLVQWTEGPASTVLDAYARLTDQLGRPGTLAAYLVGITAVCMHLGLGLSRAALTFRLAKDTSWTVYVAGALAAMVLFGWLQVLAWYAIGEPLLPFFVPTPAP
jgi:succinate dehydrogenase/fumarate reductase cytochrome b subunit